MNISPIKTELEYRQALNEIEGLMRARSNAPAGERLDLLARSVEAWEATHYALDC